MWKPVEGYEGNYEINEYGDIKSHYRSGKLLRWHEDAKGYLRTTLCLNGKMETVKKHRVVAKHFIPNPKNKPQVNHKDNNKKNNHVDNLEWVTNQENMDHANESGYRDGIYSKGEDHHASKLTKNDVINIRLDYQDHNISRDQLADRYNVTKETIWNILFRKTWKHVYVERYTVPEKDSNHNKLTEEDATQIKRLALESGKKQKEIAKMFGVARNTVSRIKTGKRWPNIQV